MGRATKVSRMTDVQLDEYRKTMSATPGRYAANQYLRALDEAIARENAARAARKFH